MSSKPSSFRRREPTSLNHQLRRRDLCAIPSVPSAAEASPRKKLCAGRTIAAKGWRSKEVMNDWVLLGK